MITELFLRLHHKPPVIQLAPDVALVKLKKHCKKLPGQQHQQAYLLQLDQLFLRYMLHPCQLNRSTSASLPDLDPLKSPAYRHQILQRLPLALQKLLCNYRHGGNLPGLLQTPKQLQDAIALANQPPFTSPNHLLQTQRHLQQALSPEQLAMVVCSVLIKQEGLGNLGDATEQALWLHGLQQAYISSQLASEAGACGLHGFICAAIHLMSLIYIHRLLKQQDGNYSHALEQQILALLPRLDYWLAKDLGLPDPLLLALRHRFADTQQPSALSEVLQKSKHAALAVLLHQRQQFSRNQLQQFLQAMGLAHLQLPEQLLNTTH